MAQLKINDSYPLLVREQAQGMHDRMGSKKQVGPEPTPYIKHGQMTVYRSGAVTFHIRGRCVDPLTGKRSKAFNKKVGNAWGDDYATVLNVAAQLLNKVQAGLNPRHAEQTLDDFHASVVTLIRQVLDSWPDCETRYRLHIAPRVGHLPVSAIQARQLQNIVDEVARTGSNPLANRVRAEIKAIFRIADEQGLLTERNPAARLRGYPENPPRNREPSLEELAALCKSAFADKDRHAGLLVIFLNLVPLRISEALGLRWDDLSLDTPTPLLSVRHTKNMRPLRLPLSPEVVAVIEKLAAIRRGSFVFPSQDGTKPKPRPDSAFRRICERAGVVGLTWHTFRKGWCSRACRAGIPIEIASAMLNHSDISVTAKHYRVVNLPELARAAQLVNAATVAQSISVEG